MKSGGKSLICLLCFAALSGSVKAVINDSAEADGSPYTAIWQRNVFDLKPTPPPPPPVAPPKDATVSNVILKGITTILGKKQVLIDLVSGGKQPGKPESFILTEGQRQDGLEILEINQKKATVKINNDGVESTITFLTNAPAAGGPPAMVGSGTPVRGGAFVPPSFNPPGAPMNGGAYTPTPIRPVRTPDYSGGVPQSGYVQPMIQGGVATGSTGTSAGLNIPGALFSQTAPQLNVQQSAQQYPTAEEAATIVAIQHQIHDTVEVANGTMPPLPPVPGLTDTAPSGNSTTSGNSASPNTSGAPPAFPTYTPPVPAWLQAKRTGSLGSQ